MVNFHIEFLSLPVFYIIVICNSWRWKMYSRILLYYVHIYFLYIFFYIIKFRSRKLTNVYACLLPLHLRRFFDFHSRSLKNHSSSSVHGMILVIPGRFRKIKNHEIITGAWELASFTRRKKRFEGVSRAHALQTPLAITPLIPLAKIPMLGYPVPLGKERLLQR